MECKIELLTFPVSIHAPAGGATTQRTNKLPHRLPVSIHAPAGGATSVSCFACFAPSAFQSTRPQGARHSFHPNTLTMYSFNPRARRGRDLFDDVNDECSLVSIHAPAGGATSGVFNHDRDCKFQSTRPQGARPHCQPSRQTNRCFNPRARRGRDVSIGNVNLEMVV